METSTAKIVNVGSVLEQERQNQEVLTLLLDRQFARSDALLVETASMAGTESYVATLTFQRVAGLLRFAKDLGLFAQMFDPQTGEMKIDHETIEEIQQRPLDHSRQLPLTLYLAGRKYHKFPAILAVQTDDWVDASPETTPEWELAPDGNYRAVTDCTRFTPLDSDGRLGLLKLLGYMYALDGQHRLLGIQGLIELINTRRIAPKTKSGDPTKLENSLSLDELAAKYGVDPLRLNALQNETIAVEIIPAVKRGETREEARRRVKSVFTHVNKSAVALTPGQLAQLDEDDGFTIVAKRIAVRHPLLRSTGVRASNPRVDWQKSTISNTSAVLTTLQTLKEMSKRYLYHQYPHWVSPVKGLIPVRPEDDELAEGLHKLSGLLDGLATLDSVQELDRGQTTLDFRLLHREDGKAHLLFRPVGQIALAGALGTLVWDQGKEIKEMFRMIRDYEKRGGLAIDVSTNPWWAVVYDSVGQKMARGGEQGAEKLFVWLLGGITDPTQKEELRQLLIQRRTIRDGGVHDGKVLDFNESYVEPDGFKLPPMLT